MEKLYQGFDQIIKTEIDFVKSIIVVELANGKRYFKEFENLDNMKSQIQEVASRGEKC